MTTTTSTPSESIVDVQDVHRLPGLCWRAIIGGTIAAIGIQILLTFLGLGAGLATFSPLTDQNPVEHFNVGAAVIWSVCALVSLWFGAMLAGRFSYGWHSGFVHGILVWSLTLIITVLLLSTGISLVLGGGLKALGAGIGMGGKALSAGAGDAAKEALKRTGDVLNSFTEEAVQSVPTNSMPKAATRARREVGETVARLFAPDNDLNSQTNRTAAIHALMDATQMNEADATSTVDGWISSYRELKSDLDEAKTKAEQKARELADQAARQVSEAAIWTFFALLVGLIVSAVAGSCGAKCALKHRDERIVTTKTAV